MAAAMPEGPSGGRARPWRASCGTKQIFFGVGAAENYGAACHLGKAALRAWLSSIGLAKTTAPRKKKGVPPRLPKKI